MESTMLLRKLHRWIRKDQPPTTAPSVLDTQVGIAVLNEQAPLKEKIEGESGEEVFLCREAILGRDQRIAGYQFMLQENTLGRIRVRNTQSHQMYTEILIRSVINAELGSLLGHRLAFIDIPVGMLENVSLQDLSPTHTVLCLQAEDTAFSMETLSAQVHHLRSLGFHIGVPDPGSAPQLETLLPQANIVILHASTLNANEGLKLAEYLRKQAPTAQILIRELRGMEDFRFSRQLGATLFQGPFITSREEWQDHNLNAAQMHILLLLQKLSQDAEIREIVDLVKKDPAISIRLLRYINSAANGLNQKVSSIENALTVLGQAQLCRWLTLLLCLSGEHNGRSEAALENALTRARMMELLGNKQGGVCAEALFLTGLLSLIDVILQEPMNKALASLAIAPEISNAILQRSGPYAAFLELAIACEQRDAEKIKLVATQAGPALSAILEAYSRALQWTLEIQSELE